MSAEEKILAGLPHTFFVLAKRDVPLAIALHAQRDLVNDGDFADALKLNKAIATRLELLALTQPEGVR
jgi:hypothetical protein